MSPFVGDDTVFEQNYMAILRARLTPLGVPLRYEADLAAFDMGLHLYELGGTSASLGSSRIWIQAKGIRETTLGAAELASAPDVAVKDLRLEWIEYWYRFPEPVYLIVYIEAADQFLAADVRALVDTSGGLEQVFDQRLAGQATRTLRIPSASTLDSVMAALPRHSSLRIDGPAFRGRPLGHRLDPLRNELEPMDPALFRAVVSDLLGAHEFRHQQDVDLAGAFGRAAGSLTVVRGQLYLTYEWTIPIFTEFGYDPGADFRIESPPFHAHDDVVVIVDAEPVTAPIKSPESERVLTELRDSGVTNVLVFLNDSDDKGFSTWRHVCKPFTPDPQGLGSLAFNVLTTTLVYLEHLPTLRFKYRNYLQ